MKYYRLLKKHEDTERYTAILDSTLKEKEEKDRANDEYSQTTQDNQSTIREATNNEKLDVRNYIVILMHICQM